MRLLILFISFLISGIANGQILNASSPYRVRASGCSYLLDQYSGAAAAYSLRKLDADYAGSAIRVRRSSDNTEQDIGFTGTCGDLDTASLKTFVGTGGTDDGFVVKWYDQTSGDNASNGTAAFQPLIMDNGVILREGGLPKINWGTSANSYHLNIETSGFLNGATSLSYFHVATVNDYASSNAGVFGPGGVNSVGLELLMHTVISRRSFLRINGTARNDNSGAAYQLWDDATQSITTVLGNSTSMAAYKNGSAVTLTSSAAMPALNFNGIYLIGGYQTNFMRGSFQELIIYSTDQTSNRAGIESNINAYYTTY